MRKKINLHKKLHEASFWVLFFFATFFLFSSFAHKTFALNSTITPTLKNNTPQITPPKPTPTPKPLGPVLNLSFTITGIGSQEGNLKPTRPKRSLTIFLYAPDVNSNDSSVNPLYTIQSSATFDSDAKSPSYGQFTNQYIDLGDAIQNGSYQVVFATDQALKKVIKSNDNEVGGTIFKLEKGKTVILPTQQVIIGDISPSQGNNVLDINDYNALISCFGKSTCDSFAEADLNDDGVIDGVDYNILEISFQALINQGVSASSLFPAPGVTVTISPTAKPTEQPTPEPKTTLAPKKGTTKSGGINPLVGFILFLIILVGGYLGITQTPFGKNLPSPLKKKSQVTPMESVAETSPPADTVAAATEIPIETAEAEKTAIAPLPTAPTPPVLSEGIVENTYYVKQKSTDEKGTWVTLTDDAGPIDGLLPTGTIEDGFEKIRGKIIEENGKKYILIQEILPAD